MSIKKTVIANWKMNGSIQMIDDFFNRLSVRTVRNTDAISSNLIIALPSLYIQYGTDNSEKTLIAAQNCHSANSGAYTGEISAQMLRDIDCSYCIIGHSERRDIESNEIIQKKFTQLMQNDITPILCVGEPISEKDNFENFIRKQLVESCINHQEDNTNEINNNKDLREIMIAYEPIWSIGTGLIPSSDEIHNRINIIRKIALEEIGLNENRVKFLYGGSVNNSNISEIVKISNLNGVLVGGASLKFDEFFEILNICDLHNQ
jgi:triosephosphate isomerase (TIM)